MSKKKVLFVLTSHSQLGSTGRATGWYLSEVSHPWLELRSLSYEIEFASPQGGAAPMDESSRDLEDAANRAFLADPSAVSGVASTRRPETLRPEDYVAVFYAGGHGTMWDLADNQPLARLAAAVYEQGGAVAAVCHGPSGLVNVRLSDGAYLVGGKRVAAFTNAEEAEVELTDVVPFALETALRERGARIQLADPWSENVAVDGRLVTGQNPQSARKVGAELVALLAGR